MARTRDSHERADCRRSEVMTIAMGTCTACIGYDPETQLCVGIAPGIRSAHTQGATLDEVRANRREVLELCLEEMGSETENLPQFVGVQ